MLITVSPSQEAGISQWTVLPASTPANKPEARDSLARKKNQSSRPSCRAFPKLLSQGNIEKCSQPYPCSHAHFPASFHFDYSVEETFLQLATFSLMGFQGQSPERLIPAPKPSAWKASIPQTISAWTRYHCNHASCQCL